MTSCREARASIIAVLRQQATDAERLRLEEHLTVCASCRAEKSQSRLLEVLRDEPPARLASEARGRVLQQILRASPAEAQPRPRLGHRLRWPALLAVAIVAVVVVKREWISREDGRPSGQGREEHADAILDQIVNARSPGILEVPGVRISYGAGTALRLTKRGRALELYAGEVNVDVTPGGPGRFRVLAPRFVVEVVGTRFIVRMTGVETLQGTVRVADANGRDLALLSASESWSLGDPCRLPPVLTEGGPLPVATVSCSLHSGESQAGAEAPSAPQHREGGGTARPSGKSRVNDLLAEARRALADRDAELARKRIGAALAERPAVRQRAAAGLLLAASFLVEQRYDEAMGTYRVTAGSFANYAEGEAAAFAVAQLLHERARTSEARAAFQSYLARYPQGRFAPDARRKLASLP